MPQTAERTRTRAQRNDTTPVSVEASSVSIVGAFPGLGSRAAYRDLRAHDLVAASHRISETYRKAASGVIGYSSVDSFDLTATQLPADDVERQAAIAVGVLVHSIALADRFDMLGGLDRFDVLGYTGESFGMLASAVAAGSLSIDDAAAVAQIFAPLMLSVAGAHGQGPVALKAREYTDSLQIGRPAVDAELHVIGIEGKPHRVQQLVADLVQRHPDSIEVHKRYSPRQVNIYVHPRHLGDVVDLVREHPDVSGTELKPPTRFIAHSWRMSPAKQALGAFIADSGISFADPLIPVIANHRSGMIGTADEMRQAILAMTDLPMNSAETARAVDRLHPDLVIEFGPGRKSLEMLHANHVSATGVSVADPAQVDAFVHAADRIQQIRTVAQDIVTVPYQTDSNLPHDVIRTALRPDTTQVPTVVGVLERLTRPTSRNSLYLYGGEQPPAALSSFIDVLRATVAHRDDIDEGDLVISSRVKKQKGESPSLAYVELYVQSRSGRYRTIPLDNPSRSETVVVHFELPSRTHIREATRLGREIAASHPLAETLREALISGSNGPQLSFDVPVNLEEAVARADAVDVLVQQLATYELMTKHRRAIFDQNHVFLGHGDLFGWLASLVAAGALQPHTVVPLAAAALKDDAAAHGSDHLRVIESVLTDSEQPLVGPDGSLVSARADLLTITESYIHSAGPRDDRASRPIRVGASVTVITLCPSTDLGHLDTAPYPLRTIVISDIDQIWVPGLNAALDDLERASLLAHSAERSLAIDYARSRNLIASTVLAYVEPGEQLLGFGAGGSESMTLFFNRYPDLPGRTVRKVLSEALTSANWDPNGKGVMLPPFTKAREQAEYLMKLPEDVAPYFPRVHNMVEMGDEPTHTDTSRKPHEVIYEMSYVPGTEIGEYIRQSTPAPAVVARIYREIGVFLRDKVHTARRRSTPDDVLEIQYFKKIEDRLALCRKTAPATFSNTLLDSPTIEINGHSYRNYNEILKILRERVDYRHVLRAPHLSLVMGDTNTENIKAVNLRPLMLADRLIRRGADSGTISAALDSITAKSLDLRFLDPRAIGYRSAGASTVDDPMYDNKPWHNSLGHYDEIHAEMFDIDYRVRADGVPVLDITFTSDNPYAQAYRVEDLAERNEDPRSVPVSGIERYFADEAQRIHGATNDDPFWIQRFVFTMGTHFTAMPPFHFTSEVDGSIIDTPAVQRRPLAIYAEGIKWLNWAVDILEGTRSQFLGIDAPVHPMPRTETVSTLTGTAQ
ncbi:hypothetical protein [Rhodococcus sp. IEGM 1330]|uniref:hypothetical protein n=1 Tax=Rhodococcus sp. IEGM 1330 TaxID=3082225 RepID=UPI0029538CBC|nr:hypothetical protein [Rhodococcus sp. IEGM 1330]MDV8022653.1 hypothetical protein [Rhodococcus sp. IEGM 1330]